MKSANLRRMMSVAYTKNGERCRNSNADPGFKRTEIRQAITLLWISVLYIACQSPKVIPDFFEAINCDYQSVGNISFRCHIIFVINHITELCECIYIYRIYLYDHYLQETGCRLPSAIKIIIALSNLFVVVNSTSNFFIYIWKGNQFRRILQNKITRRQNSQYYHSTLDRSNTTRVTVRVPNMMEMNSMVQCCE